MTITNIGDEIREGVMLQNRIDSTSEKRLAFSLKALLASGHITRHVAEKALDLADTIPDLT